MTNGTAEPLSIPSSDRPLPLVALLANALAEAGVRYCHWKSKDRKSVV